MNIEEVEINDDIMKGEEANSPVKATEEVEFDLG